MQIFLPFDLQMDTLSSLLTEYSQSNEADTPRTPDLSHLRAKRVAYYESIGIIKSLRNDSQTLSTVSQDTKVNPSDYRTFKQGNSLYLATAKQSLLQEESRLLPEEVETLQDQRPQERTIREICLKELDLCLLADTLVPKAQKLQHVINWAQKFLSTPLQEHDLKSSQKSLEFPQSSFYQSSKTVGNQKTTHLRSSDYSLVLTNDQFFNTEANIPSFFLHPPNELSEKTLSSEFSNSILMEGFPVSHSYEWQEVPTVRDEGDGRPDSPDSLQQEDSTQGKSDRAENSHIQNLSEDGVYHVVVMPQSIHTSEGNNLLEEKKYTLPMNDYFWTPLTDSSEEEDLYEPVKYKEAGRGLVSRNYWAFSGSAFPSENNNSILVSNCTAVSGDISSGESTLETGVREECKGATEYPMEPYKNISVEFKDKNSRGVNLIQRLHGDQFMCLSPSSNEKTKDSDKMEFSLGSAHTKRRYKNDWKLSFVENSGTSMMEKVISNSKESMWNSSQISPSGISQEQFILTHPESCLAPKPASLSVNFLETPGNSAAPHAQLSNDVYCGFTAHTEGISTGFDQIQPPDIIDGRSVQTPQKLIMNTIHEQNEKTFCSNHSISRDISKNSLKRFFPRQNFGTNISWSDKSLPKPEQGSSVLETYFHYLHVLDKIRGISSKERNSSLPFQQPTMNKSGSVITSSKEKDRSNWIKMDKGTN